jgi:hypothetical protein
VTLAVADVVAFPSGAIVVGLRDTVTVGDGVPIVTIGFESDSRLGLKASMPCSHAPAPWAAVAPPPTVATGYWCTFGGAGDPGCATPDPPPLTAAPLS